MSTAASIFNIQRFCIQDGPGIRTTVFMQGCPLRCVWCHNPESKSAEKQLMFYRHKCTLCGRCLDCPSRAIDGSGLHVDYDTCTACGKCAAVCYAGANEICGRTRTTDEIFDEVMQDKIFYGDTGGMTLSGGEPGMQPEASLDLLHRAKEAGITTVVETSGQAPRSFFRDALPLTTWFYYDLKGMDDAKHQENTGVSNGAILGNLEYLLSEGANIVIRIPLIPGYNDTDEDLALLRAYLVAHGDAIHHAEIMKYHYFGSGKAAALGKPYAAPLRNATAEEATRWLDALQNDTISVRLS